MKSVNDEHFDLVSVLYHTLQQGETCEKFKADANTEGDSELTELFGSISQNSKELAVKIKALLADRIIEAADSVEVASAEQAGLFSPGDEQSDAIHS